MPKAVKPDVSPAVVFLQLEWVPPGAVIVAQLKDILSNSGVVMPMEYLVYLDEISS